MKNLHKDIKHIITFRLKPKEAIEYLKQKGYKLSFNYQELMHEAHHKAFTVAKIQRLDLLYDIKESILNAQKNGLSFNSWKKNIKPILIKKGWWGEVEAIDKQTGEIKTIKVNTKRLKTIFYTNTRVAYQVAKAKKYYADKNITYLRYIAILDNSVRPSHKAMHGIVLPKDHPFWEKNFPPNGWNCRCRIRAISKLTEKRYQEKIEESLLKVQQTPLIADKDWAYDIREGMFFDKFSVKNIEAITDKEVILKNQTNYEDFNLPKLKEIDRSHFETAPNKLPKQKTQEDAFNLLKKEILGDKKELIINTPLTQLFINEESLKHIIFDHDREDAREQFAKFILPTLTNPLEIWAVSERTPKDGYFKKRYNFFKIFKTKKDNVFVNIKLLRDGRFTIATMIRTKDLNYLNRLRKGILMYFNKDILGD